MEESQAIKKFRTVLQHFDLNDKVKEIEFCENQLDSAVLGKVETVVEYRILLDKALLTDPEKMESGWNGLMADFSHNVVPCLSTEDRAFLVFLHELGHVVNGHCYEDYPLGDSQSQEADEGEQEEGDEENEREQVAWDFAWRVYRAYSAGQEQAD